MTSPKNPPTPPASSPPADEASQLRAEKEALSQELLKLKDIAGRAQADLQNAKERMERERQEVAKWALDGFFRKLLPTIDNFQRAFQHRPEELKDHEWTKGVAAIEQEFLKLITDAGLQKIESLGLPVDPQKHEVLMTGPGEAGKVIEVFEDGYMLNGRVLRVAKVRAGI